MPIYKMTGRRDGKQKYRVRINFIDLLGKKRQIDRVVYGAEEAKLLELQLKKSIKDETPSKGMTFSELFEEYCAVKRIRIHDFRHSHASVLANNGVNIQEIARRLGHSNVEITWNTYSHLYPKEEERATDILNKIL